MRTTVCSALPFTFITTAFMSVYTDDSIADDDYVFFVFVYELFYFY
jgi:hypothetical protein